MKENSDFSQVENHKEEEFEGEDPEAEGKPDGDEVGHLELTCEMLELAKSIWATCGKTDMEAEALHYLGEVCLIQATYIMFFTDVSVPCTGEFGEQELPSGCGGLVKAGGHEDQDYPCGFEVRF